MKQTRRLIIQALITIICVCIYSSCSGDDYINAIPGNSNALIAVDCKAVGEQTGQQDGRLLKSLFKVDDVEDCGIDLTSKLFFFETTDGNLGSCVKVNDEEKLKDWLTALSKDDTCSKPTEKREMTFTLLKGSWAVGFNGKAMIIIGPVLPAQQAEAIRSIAKYLKQEEDDGVKGSQLFEKLDSIDSPIAMVAQATALPEKISAPFTLGAPKEADASQIFIAAAMKTANNGCLNITGESFSFDKGIDKGLKENIAKFRKINGKYTSNIPGNTLCSIFMNVKGTDFVNMMKSNAGLGSLLAGMNTAVDMDNILRSVDGDLALGISSYSEEKISMTMAAQLAKSDFLEDVDYWKKSCPAGSSIENCGKNSFWFKSSDTNFWFGVSDSNEFYGSTDKDIAFSILKPSKTPLPAEVRKETEDQRFCMTLNLKQLLNDNKELTTFTDMLKPLFGDINNVIYCIK